MIGRAESCAAAIRERGLTRMRDGAVLRPSCSSGLAAGLGLRRIRWFEEGDSRGTQAGVGGLAVGLQKCDRS